MLHVASDLRCLGSMFIRNRKKGAYDGRVFRALFAIELSSTAIWRERERFHVLLGKVRAMTHGNGSRERVSDQLVRRSESQKRFE